MRVLGLSPDRAGCTEEAAGIRRTTVNHEERKDFKIKVRKASKTVNRALTRPRGSTNTEGATTRRENKRTRTVVFHSPWRKKR